MKGKLLLLFGLLLITLLPFFFFREMPLDAPSSQGRTSLYVGGVLVFVEIADTIPKQVRGLSGKESLQENEGLLFAFGDEAKHGIWMKEMRFPIDIVWAKEGGEIVHTERQVSPDTYPQVFEPDENARYVLELPAGFLDRNNIQEGGVLSRPMDL